jgi:hypothetical protein
VIVLVDGVQANPQNGDDFALCTSLPNGVDFQWVGAVRQSLIKVPKIGTHAVQIQVDLNNGATEWWHPCSNDLGGTASLLRPRLQALNPAFSEQGFQRNKQTL